MVSLNNDVYVTGMPICIHVVKIHKPDKVREKQAEGFLSLHVLFERATFAGI